MSIKIYITSIETNLRGQGNIVILFIVKENKLHCWGILFFLETTVNV